MKATVLFVLAAIMAACTPKMQYELYRGAGQAQAECHSKRTQQEMQACVRDYEMSFEEYQRLRDEVVR